MKTTHTTRRAVAILARVSTRNQGEHGHSLNLQKDIGRKYAAEIGATEIEIFEGVESGTTINRAILGRMLKEIVAGRFHALIVQDILRLARHPRVMSDVIECLKKARVELHDLNGPIHLDTAEGEFNVMLQSIIGRMTARQGVEKSIKVRLRLLGQGKPAAGRPPWGREWDKGREKFVLVPAKGKLLRAAKDLICRRQKSLAETATALQIPKSSLRKAINQASCVQVVQHLEGKEFRFACAPILTEKEQRQMTASISANATVRTRVAGKHLLQGLVRCASCGASMTGQTKNTHGKSYSLYRHPPERELNVQGSPAALSAR